MLTIAQIQEILHDAAGDILLLLSRIEYQRRDDVLVVVDPEHLSIDEDALLLRLRETLRPLLGDRI